VNLTENDYVIAVKPDDATWDVFFKLVYSMDRVPLIDPSTDKWQLKRIGDEWDSSVQQEAMIDCINLRNFRLVIAHKTPDVARIYVSKN